MSGRSARAGRVAGAVCLTTLMAASLTACAASPDERIAGKRWQVTEIYDDPALPRGVPEGTMPPMIAFGRESYTGDGACGSFQGALTWRDEGIVAVGEPQTVREAECDGKTLFDTAKKILDEPDRLRTMRAAASNTAVVDAAERIYQTAIELAKA